MPESGAPKLAWFKEVLRIGTNFEFVVLVDVEGLAEGEVEVAVVRTVHRVTANIAVGVRCWRCVRVLVEPVCERMDVRLLTYPM